jgi:hypothetical protein
MSDSLPLFARARPRRWTSRSFVVLVWFPAMGQPFGESLALLCPGYERRKSWLASQGGQQVLA